MLHYVSHVLKRSISAATQRGTPLLRKRWGGRTDMTRPRLTATLYRTEGKNRTVDWAETTTSRIHMAGRRRDHIVGRRRDHIEV